MQKILFIIFFICTFNVYSQKDSIRKLENHLYKIKTSKERKKAVFSLDTVFYLGKPIAKYKKAISYLIGYSDYTLSSLKNDEELLNVSLVHFDIKISSISYYNVAFLSLGKNMQMSTYLDELTVICEFNIFNDSGLIEENVEKLILSKSLPLTNNSQIYKKETETKSKDNKSKTTNLKTIERDIKGKIVINNSIIKQSNKTIGSYTIKTETIDNLKVNNYLIYYTDGSICAKASKDDKNSTEISILTENDNKIHILNILNDSDLERIIEYLILNNYL